METERRQSVPVQPVRLASLQANLTTGLKPETQAENAAKRKAWRDSKIEDETRLRTAAVRLPRRFEHCTNFAAVDWVNAKNPKAVETCREFSLDPVRAPSPFLMGKSGTGKTHLFWTTLSQLVITNNTAARRWADQKIISPEADPIGHAPGMRFLITNGAEVAHELRQSVKTDRISETVEKFRQTAKDGSWDGGLFHMAPILFVDDIEVMKMGDWLAEELYRIIDYRYAEKLPTMLVSNLSPEELRSHLGDRIARRMLDMTKPIVMK